MKTLTTLIIGLLMYSTATAQQLPQVGEKAPEFTMTGSDKKTYSSQDFVGKQAVIIAWFPRAFTKGCTAECKSMKDSGEILKSFDVAYFTASTDTVDKNADFAASLMLDFPILCDPDFKNAKAFGVLRADGATASRVTFIIGKDGKVLSVDDKVKTESHGKDLADLLVKLGIAKKAK